MDPVVHFEMPAEDKKRMSEFYSKVFGWKTNQLGPEMGEYVVVTTSEVDEKRMVKAPGTINGGFYQKIEDKLSHSPSVVIAVKDIDETIKKIKKFQGKISGKIEDIPGIGKHVSFIDTEGNRVSILQPLMT